MLQSLSKPATRTTHSTTQCQLTVPTLQAALLKRKPPLLVHGAVPSPQSTVSLSEVQFLKMCAV